MIKDQEAEYQILKAFIKYSKFSWTTWIIYKIFIKLTTYSILKDRGMEEEANQSLSDWGPIADPFIAYVVFPGLRLVMIFIYPIEQFTDDIINDYLVPLYDILKPFLVLLRDLSSQLLLFHFSVSETGWVCVHYIDSTTFVSTLLILYAFANTFCFIWKKIVEMEDDQEESLMNKKGRKVSRRSKAMDASTLSLPAPPVYSCWFCAKPGVSLQKCSVCRRARYCGETCQWGDWGRHRERCRGRGERGNKRKTLGSDEVD